MKYVILIYGNPASRAVWDGFTPDQQAEGLKIYAALNAELRASGEMVVSQALADPADGRRVMVSDGVAMATDGPFAEVKEHLAGFYVVDCASWERGRDRRPDSRRRGGGWSRCVPSRTGRCDFFV